MTQRGNGKQTAFRTASDYALYLDLLRNYATHFDLATWAYCLLPNHVHLVCVPGNPRSLWLTLGRTHSDMARHFNIVGRSYGHVWQARFFSCPLDRAHRWRAMAYMDRNPVRAGHVTDAQAYRRSSALAHTDRTAAGKLLEFGPWLAEYGYER